MRGFAKAGLIGTALLGAMATTASAEIKCQDGSQLIQGNWMATPYCQDKLLAQVANARGFKTSFAAIRNNPNHKKELCRFLYTRYPRADDVHGRGRAGVLRRRPLGAARSASASARICAWSKATVCDRQSATHSAAAASSPASTSALSMLAR